MNRAGRLADRLLRLDQIILDETGYLPFSPSKRASIVIKTNLSFSECAGVSAMPR